MWALNCWNLTLPYSPFPPHAHVDCSAAPVFHAVHVQANALAEILLEGRHAEICKYDNKLITAGERPGTRSGGRNAHDTAQQATHAQTLSVRMYQTRNARKTHDTYHTVRIR